MVEVTEPGAKRNFFLNFPEDLGEVPERMEGVTFTPLGSAPALLVFFFSSLFSLYSLLPP